MSENKGQNFLHGAAILAAGVVVMKILGAIYKIPLGNILGDEGYSYFFVAYTIYNFLLTVATAGFPVALSRMISEANALGRPMQVRRTFRVALTSFAVIGALFTAVMYLFPVELANFMNQERAAQGIWALSPAVLLVCLVSAYRGHAQGLGNMIPTTVGQVLEVLVKVIVGLALSWYLTKLGKSLPIASAGAVFGVVAGGLAALIYMAAFKARNYRDTAVASPDVPDSCGRIFSRLMRIGIPITLGASVMSLISLIDTKFVLLRLKTAAGFTEEAADILFGVYGKAMTLYNLPAAFITPLTISVVPAISACVARRARLESCSIAEASVRITSVLALPMGIGLSVLCDPIMRVLYWDSHESGPALLMLMGVASFFVCITLITNAILQAHGNEKLPMLSMAVGSLTKIAVNWVLVGDPDINIYGAPIGTICCYLVMCVMNIAFMFRCMERRPSLSGMFLRPLISSLLMGASAWLVYTPVSSIALGVISSQRLAMALAMVCAIGCACIVYLVLIIVTRAVTYEDMKLIPKGEKLAKLLHIR
ncbi:MAG: putative polysaccharide biosynthesis protein [Candidatus Heteroscillospira sp.]|jgi:stage V sporulation protein B